jgi:tetrahydromethanopterin S-methyltransferase subunit G
MEAMRESWTDERLDDFRAEANRHFDEVARRFEDVDRRFEDVDRRFDRVEGRIESLASEMNARFDGLQRSLIITQATFIAALLGLFATQL